jgi:hypothetical protein
VRRLAPFWLATLLSLIGVSCAGSADPPLAVHVDWGLDGPAGMIPSSVTQLTVLVYSGLPSDPQRSIHTIPNLMDMDDDGHPDLVNGGLPTDRPVRLTILGQGAGGATLFVGHAGPFQLEVGERRYVDLRMYAVGGFSSLEMGTMTPRMLATATALSDGRVLVAGGFTRAANMACPTGVATGATCFDLTAASDAFIFDVASGAFLPVHGGMHQARGGHTATLLPNDRVLLAGGAAHAVLVLTPNGGMGNYAPSFLSLDTTAQAATSFEVFLPDANAETEDTNRDGDQGRGGFTGAADDATSLGRLDAPRFQHAAAVVPGHPSQVLLAGGLDSPDSWAIYDDARAGGYGVLDSTMNHLHSQRPSPSIVPLHAATGDSLWIIGGGDAAANADLAEVWTQTAAAPNGSTVPATMRMFPDGMATSADHPEYAFLGATAVALDPGHAVVVGWYGPLCNATGPMAAVPMFAGATGLTRCDFAISTRSFTIDGMTGRAVATTTHTRHAFGAGVHLTDGSALVTGGAGTLMMNPGTGLEHFAAMVPATGSAQISMETPPLAAARSFHAMAALDDAGALVIGGLNINGSSTVPTVTLVGLPEILYLTAPM